MSGSTIGGVVGAFVGYFFGNPQLGWMIGSAIGGYVDPEQVSQFGPRLSDAQQQTARDGLPIPYGYGTFPVHGNIIWCGPVVEHVDESTDDGKGSGVETTTTTYSYTRSYAIGICQGEIAGLLVIKRNGKIVFDARTDAELTSLGYTAAQIQEARAAAASANLRFVVYTGSETQTADPTIEAHEGVGNVPGHRGLAYIVVTDDEVTELRGAVPQYEFVVAVDGTSQDLPEDYHAKLYGGSPFPFDTNNTSLRDPRKAGVTYQYSASTGPTVWRDTVGEALDDAAAALGNDINGQPKLIESPQLMGWSPENFLPGDGIDPDTEFAPWDDAVSDCNDQTTVTLAYSRRSFVSELEEFVAVYFGAYEACSSLDGPTWCRDTHDSTDRFKSGVVVPSASVLPGFSDFLTCGAVTGDGIAAGAFYYYADVPILCRAIADCEGAPEGYVELPDAPGYYVTPDGSIEHHGNCEAEAGTYKQLSVLNVEAGDDFQPFITRPSGPVLESADPDYDNQAYWDAAYAAAVAAGILPEGLTYSSTGTGVAGEFYPVEVSSVCGCAQDVSAIELDTVLLADIVAAEFQRVGLTSDDYDVSDLEGIEVLGYRVLPNGSGVDASLGPLMQAYFFDIAEWDGKLRCIKRGGASSLSLTMDDLAERDGEAIEWTRVQEAELLRLQTVAYIDPRAGYTPTTQKWERRAGTVQAKGEAAVEVPITATADTAAGIAKKRGLIAWAETEKAKLSLPYRRAKVTPTDVLTLTDADGEAHRLRVGQIEDDSGVRLLEVTKERGNVYGATATGVNPNNPTVPSSGLIGATIAHYMNLPRLRSQDNKPGVYVAVTGLLPGWKGADIYVSADGGVSEQRVARIMSRATMGYLAEAVTASGEPITVTLRDGRTLSTITADQLAARQNGFAITSDATSEVGQFQTATENADDDWELTDTLRGQMGTTAASHLSGDTFVLLDQAVFFMPLDISLAGKTLIMRAVSIGTANDDNTTISFVFDPQFTGPEEVEFLLDTTGEKLLDEAGAYLLE